MRGRRSNTVICGCHLRGYSVWSASLGSNQSKQISLRATRRHPSLPICLRGSVRFASQTALNMSEQAIPGGHRNGSCLDFVSNCLSDRSCAPAFVEFDFAQRRLVVLFQQLMFFTHIDSLSNELSVILLKILRAASLTTVKAVSTGAL
jgi:hypothetical protein